MSGASLLGQLRKENKARATGDEILVVWQCGSACLGGGWNDLASDRQPVLSGNRRGTGYPVSDR
ncbi:hypothetical protein ACRALDRAFT_2038092 [Sodiomyces alcalophilus JCM 7366]|uniref:uncharacterized protein n=1 Tax=Sodiomyces alcalophilus JCM 7366 TaxID=591952 RepID=UPI0039B517DC